MSDKKDKDLNEEELIENQPQEETGDDGDEPVNPLSLDMNDTPKDIVKEMEECYLDYAMSVIVSRALPDVRDGLKPVHRRILYVMHEAGLRSSAKFKKSATVVGDVLGKYHPHGDTAVYDSMVRMAQDFAMRYPLVNGQGNFGSMDGDSAAAYRYTEAKMQKITDEMLADIEKDTVPFRPNYDGRLKEPTVLPSRIPALLLNGSVGIAVGMATNIPPHNLTEVMEAVKHLIDNPEATIEDLMQHIKGPDFPTGGMIYDPEAIKTAYATGRGSIIMRGRADIEEQKSGRFHIIITEIPYQVNKSSLVESMANLVRDKKIMGISDLRDESSSREGVRLVVELKRDAFPKKVLNQLYKYTALQTSFGFNMIALIDGIQPRLLDLKAILEEFIKHRQVVVTRRTEFELRVAKARAHILEGLKIALDDIDAVIETIKKSATKEIAKENLIKKFKLSEIQAKAILEMRLQTLAGLERKKIEDELKEKLDFIKECEAILGDTKRVMAIIQTEIQEIIEKYGDARRTEVIPHAVGEFNAKALIPNEDMIVALTRGGYIKRLSPSVYRTQGRGGKGVIGMTTKDEDEISNIIYVKTHDDIYYFTSRGRVFRLPAYEVPVASRTAKGQAIVNLLQLDQDEVVTSMLDLTKTNGEYLFMATRNGTVKKTAIKDFDNVRKSGLIAIKLREGDVLDWVRPTSASDQVLIITHNGQAIRFKQEDVRSMGRASTGVRGIRLKGDDQVVGMEVVTNEESSRLLVVMENGLSKTTKVEQYRFQGRGGSGVKTANVTQKTGKVVGARVLDSTMTGDLILISSQGQMIRLPMDQVPTSGRATQGVYVMRMKDSDKVASLSLILDDEPSAEADKQELPLKK